MDTSKEEIKEVLFAMLGPTSSGKTVAGTVLYHSMSGNRMLGKKKLLLKSDGAFVTDLNNRWRELQNGGKFPAGSTRNSTYDLTLYSENRALLDIGWLDYRGSLLYEDRGDSSDNNFNQVSDALSDQAVLVIVISAEVLNSYIKWNSLKAKQILSTDEIADLAECEYIVETDMQIYQRILDTADKHDEKPLVFLLTKSDLVKVSDHEKMCYMRELLESYGLTEGHKVILTHCTLGRNLVCGKKAFNDGEQKIVVSDTRTINPEGFELPLLFVVGYRFSSEGNKWEIEHLRKIADLDEAESAFTRAVNNYSSQISDTYNGGFFGFFTKRARARKRANLQQMKADAQKKIRELEEENRAEKNQVNKAREVSESILEYIEAKARSGNTVPAIYVNDKGEERPLREFFA